MGARDRLRFTDAEETEMTVRRRGKRWMIDIDYTHPTGQLQRVRKVSPIQTRRGTEQYEREVRQALADGTYGKEVEPQRRLTVASAGSFPRSPDGEDEPQANQASADEAHDDQDGRQSPPLGQVEGWNDQSQSDDQRSQQHTQRDAVC